MNILLGKYRDSETKNSFRNIIRLIAKMPKYQKFSPNSTLTNIICVHALQIYIILVKKYNITK